MFSGRLILHHFLTETMGNTLKNHAKEMPQKSHGRVIGVDWAVPLRCASWANRCSKVQYHRQGSLMFALEAIRLEKNSIEFQFPSNFHQISIKIDPIRTDHSISSISRAPGHHQGRARHVLSAGSVPRWGPSHSPCAPLSSCVMAQVTIRAGGMLGCYSGLTRFDSV